MLKDKIAVIAFDKKQKELYECFCEKGVDCELVSFLNSYMLKECLKPYNKVILPFPSKKENLSFIGQSEEPLSDFFDENQLVIGGLISDEIKYELESKDIAYFDYFDYEPYVMKNAYLTTQGVVRLMLENSKTAVFGKTVLVTGFGRIGKSLALMLKGLGLHVCVAARNETQLSEACCLGFESVKISDVKTVLCLFDFIFNTVPCGIFSSADIGHIADKALYFEIASKPYGANEADFKKHGKAYVSASFLPGRLYPRAVSENIAELVMKGVR